MRNDQKSDRASTINTAVLVAIIGLLSGVFATLIASFYQDNESKREVSLSTISFLAKDFLKEKPIMLREDITQAQLDAVFQHKETAFLAREMTRHLASNYGHIDFRVLQSALTSIERRYSYARIYERAGLADVVCENLVLNEKKNSIQLSPRLSKCESSKLDGVVLSLEYVDSDIDQNNYRFRVTVSNDKNNVLCNNKEGQCGFWIDLGDRLESTPYQYLVLAEYIGYEDVFNQANPIVAFSIVKRKSNVVDLSVKLTKEADTSYWDYQSPFFTMNNAAEGSKTEDSDCEPFFDETATDDTPEKPQSPTLESFGLAALKACGPIRGQVSDAEFEALMNDHWEHLETVFPKNWPVDDKQKMALLKNIWLSFNGFNHIFCGEWNNGSIGGLHYRGRYLQLQTERSACYLESPEQELLDNSIYTVGVRSEDGANRHAKKGYALHQTATELFALGLDVYERCKVVDVKWEPYGNTFDKIFYEFVSDEPNDIAYRVICKASDPEDESTYGLLTIYPDASPVIHK